MKAQTRNDEFHLLEATFNRWLLIKDLGLVRIIAATVLANRLLSSDPVWLLIVAPPGGTKTELLRSLYGLDFIYPLNDLTPQTLLSGMKNDSEGSLLLRLPENAILVMKDFTTVLTMHPDKRGAILSQLREVYDGDFRKDFGTGQSKKWSGKLGFIAGVTTVIDQHQMVFQVLGERTIQYRPLLPDPIELAHRAIDNTGNEQMMREELQAAVNAFIASVGAPQKPLEVPGNYKQRIICLAVLCTRARSGVIRDGRASRQIEFVPEPEQPTRLAKQYINLFNGLALISDAYTQADYKLIYKIGMDSLPSIRRTILEYLYDQALPVPVNDIASAIFYPRNTTGRQLEELEYLRLIKRESQSQTYTYSLLPDTRELFDVALGKKERT